MGYKASTTNFQNNHLDWCKKDYWSSLDDDLFKTYGQAKLDCLLAGLKYQEEIGMASFREDEKEYHELLELSERTERVSKIIDSIMTTIIHW